jgi:hypothetical protein
MKETTPSPFKRMKLIRFERHTSNYVNDFLTFKDEDTKKRYNVIQMFEKGKNDEPESLMSTSIFDNQLEQDKAMIYHCINPDLMKMMPFTLIDHNRLSNKEFYENKDNRFLVIDILKQTINFNLKQREIEAMGLKPETKQTFKDFLGEL